MNINRLDFLFSHFHSAVDDKELDLNNLNQDERELYINVVDKLFQCFSARAEHSILNKSITGSRDYTLIFRHSKSWIDVEKMFTAITNTSRIPTNIKIWANDWLTQIAQLRTWQTSIHKYIAQLQIYTQQLHQVDPTHLENITIGASQETKIKRKIHYLIKDILNNLDTREKQLSYPPLYLQRNISSQKIIQFLKDNWDLLKLFTDWAEVNLDKEEIVVRCQKDSKLNLNNDLNKSIKAIFIIGQTSHIEMPLEYEGEEPGKIVRPTQIDVKHFQLADSSPGVKKRSSPTFQLTDELIFNCPLDLHKDDDSETSKKQVSETALKLERIVQLAIKSVNQKINGSGESSDYLFNRSGFLGYLFNL